MADALAAFEDMVRGLEPKELEKLDALLDAELKQKWLPAPGPQTDAYLSDADLLLYGGAAGGGKSDLLVGLSQTDHCRAVIFRRAYVDLRGLADRIIEIVGSRDGYNGADMVLKRDGRVLEFGALEKAGSELSWQGRAHDFIGFDEGAQLSVDKVAFVLGWLRSTKEGQRCRAVIASNPPMGGEGRWLMEWFAPWLEPLFPNPAKPGELRWAVIRGNETIWVDGPELISLGGEDYTPMSRTFIPSMLADNPYLKDTGYKTRLQNLPEPLRSQLLHGDFMAGREDHEWQVIPTAWVAAAQARWTRAIPRRRRMLALSADVALGGADNTCLSALHDDNWFAPMVIKKGAEITSPAEIADMMLAHRRDGADLSVDGTGGWGSGVRSHLKTHHQIECASLVFSTTNINAHTADGKLGFANLRAEMYWRFREALDPEGDEEMMLPPDSRLLAELTAPRYDLKGTKILLEGKDDIKKRVGSSPDSADAVVMAWHRRKAALKAERPPMKKRAVLSRAGSNAWLGA